MIFIRGMKFGRKGRTGDLSKKRPDEHLGQTKRQDDNLCKKNQDEKKEDRIE